MPAIALWILSIGGAIWADQSLMGGTFTGAAMAAVGYMFTKMGNDLLSFLFSLFPSNYGINWTVIQPYFGFAERWVPINYGFGLLTSYWGLWTAVQTARWGMKLIPFINAG